MKIFLDDLRYPKDCLGYMHTRIGALNPIYNEQWTVVRNYIDFMTTINGAMQKGIEITHISFDHDLAEEHYNPIMMVDDDEYEHLRDTFKEKTGLDCARWWKDWFEEYKDRYNLKWPMIFVHSMNPVGRQSIIDTFK